MEKEIAQLLKCLKIEYALLWVLCLVLIVLYEYDIFLRESLLMMYVLVICCRCVVSCLL